MKRNTDITAAWHYHRVTSHSWERLQQEPHALDWANYPRPFKVYRHLPSLPLPRQTRMSTMLALDAVFDAAVANEGNAALDLASVARLLYLAAGVVRWRTYGDLRVPFRTAACTGNLHHIDVYVVCGDLGDLPAGVYHFAPHDFSLGRLRAGDFRGNLCSAVSAPAELLDTPVWFVCTSTFWRNAWKYRARTYRHAFWDCGTILANLLAAATSAGVRHRVLAGFVDEQVNALIGVDGDKEASLAVVALGRGAHEPRQSLPVPPLAFEFEPYSRHEIRYPDIVEMHRASSLWSATEVHEWRRGAQNVAARPFAGGRPLAAPSVTPPDTVEQVIARRGSTRAFRRAPIAAEVFAALLRAACAPLPADFRASAPLTDAYLIVHAVEGLDSGGYVSDSRGTQLQLLAAGNFRQQAGALALGQALAADAAANIYHLTDLHQVLPALGNRGYRAAQLEGGIAGGRVYLAAFAHRIGATGLTFFDDDVTEFFSPHAAGKSVMFLTAVGKPAGRRIAL